MCSAFIPLSSLLWGKWILSGDSKKVAHGTRQGSCWKEWAEPVLWVHLGKVHWVFLVSLSQTASYHCRIKRKIKKHWFMDSQNSILEMRFRQLCSVPKCSHKVHDGQLDTWQPDFYRTKFTSQNSQDISENINKVYFSLLYIWLSNEK